MDGTTLLIDGSGTGEKIVHTVLHGDGDPPGKCRPIFGGLILFRIDHPFNMKRLISQRSERQKIKGTGVSCSIPSKDAGAGRDHRIDRPVHKSDVVIDFVSGIIEFVIPVQNVIQVKPGAEDIFE